MGHWEEMKLKIFGGIEKKYRDELPDDNTAAKSKV